MISPSLPSSIRPNLLQTPWPLPTILFPQMSSMLLSFGNLVLNIMALLEPCSSVVKLPPLLIFMDSWCLMNSYCLLNNLSLCPLPILQNSPTLSTQPTRTALSTGATSTRKEKETEVPIKDSTIKEEEVDHLVKFVDAGAGLIKTSTLISKMSPLLISLLRA